MEIPSAFALAMLLGSVIAGIGSMMGAYRFSWSEFKSLWSWQYSFTKKDRHIFWQGLVLSICFLQLQIIAIQWQGVPDDFSKSWPLILYAITIGPLAEELVFRGLFLKSMEKRLKAGVIISSVAFGILHYPYPIAVIFSGLFYAQIRLRTKSLVYPAVVHAMTNLGSALVGYAIFHQSLSQKKWNLYGYAGLCLCTLAALFLFRRNLREIFWFPKSTEGLNLQAETSSTYSTDVPDTSSRSLVEGEDYYIENGFMVFTAKYHLKRGYCCGSGCRHCPYKNS